MFSPTLTGLSERKHLLSREVTLDQHIEDVVEVFQRQRIQDAILCGHSYGGWVISGALEHVESKVSSTVFLDAHLPEPGQRGVDSSNGRSEIMKAWERGDMARNPPPVDYFKGKPENEDWIQNQLTPQPLSVSFQPIVLTGARERVSSRTYIRATRFKSAQFDAAADRATKNGWRTFKIDCGHEVMVDEPLWLADVLVR